MTRVFCSCQSMRTALYRIFVAPVVTRGLTSNVALPIQTGFAMRAPKDVAPRAPFSTSGMQANKYRKEEDMPKDYDITAPNIMLVDNRGMTGLKKTQQVLGMLDLEEYSLRMVANPGGQLPICRVVHIKTEEARLTRERIKEREKKQARSHKILDINWGTTQHDLEYKMKQVSGYLQKGMEVQLRLVRKKNKDVADEQHKEQVKNWVRQAINDVKGRVDKEVQEPKGVVRFNVMAKVFNKLKKEVPSGDSAEAAEAEIAQQAIENAAERM